MMKPIRIHDSERRARLVARHHMAGTATDTNDAVRSLVVLHSADPATPYLAARARVRGFAIADLDRALLEERTLWRMHAMRRTLFVVGVEDGPAIEAAASRSVTARERRRLEGWLSAEMQEEQVPGFVAGLEARVLEVLEDGAERLTRELTRDIPELGMKLTLGSGKWTTRSPLSSRLLFLMAMDGRLVRTRPAGSWRSSQYRWAAATRWFGQIEKLLDPVAARAELARRYLTAHGPATLEDLRWWTGWTAKQVVAAVKEVRAVPAMLDSGAQGFLLSDDVEMLPPVPSPSVAFLPALDPTPMGWTHRGWFLGRHAESLFDRSGNIGPSVWVDGRIVGGWSQRSTGEVVFRLLEEVGEEAQASVEDQAEELTRWFAGTVVIPRFRTPLERDLSADR